ncbi:hypothetical protein SDC9_168417 [bioreactor metagenome]|uniref:Uncharacterized protein n=1 Tax=bioreactor metagenome TaxID=1076179 RepID=A0A645G2G9_9ZZZZ
MGAGGGHDLVEADLRLDLVDAQRLSHSSHGCLDPVGAGARGEHQRSHSAYGVRFLREEGTWPDVDVVDLVRPIAWVVRRVLAGCHRVLFSSDMGRLRLGPRSASGWPRYSTAGSR